MINNTAEIADQGSDNRPAGDMLTVLSKIYLEPAVHGKTSDAADATPQNAVSLHKQEDSVGLNEASPRGATHFNTLITADYDKYFTRHHPGTIFIIF